MKKDPECVAASGIFAMEFEWNYRETGFCNEMLTREQKIFDDHSTDKCDVNTLRNQQRSCELKASFSRLSHLFYE